MFEKKKLMINCDVLDTRHMKEEDYAQYEQIAVNADLVLVSMASKSILARLPMMLNNDQMLELPDDAAVSVSTVNGNAEISASTVAEEHTVLIANGNLRIYPDAGEVLKKYEHIVVNGNAECPQSLSGFLNRMTVNGSAQVYPDDCVLLKREFLLDEYFPVRAREGARYYAAKSVVITSAKVDAAALARKNVSFVTKRFIVPEELLETAVPLFDEQAECIVVPRGMALINDDAVLSEALVRRHGARLFIYGDASVDPSDKDGAVLGKLEKLAVKGTLSVTKQQEAALTALDAEYDELDVIKGRRIVNKVKARIDRALLDGSPEGVEVCNAAKVVLAEDIMPEMILEKLALVNIAQVDCTAEQESAVAAVGTNIARIGNGSDDETDGAAKSAMDLAFGMAKDLANTKMVNADSYVM